MSGATKLSSEESSVGTVCTADSPRFSDFANTIQTPTLRVISRKIEAVSGVNLAQGTCQLPVPKELIAGASEAIAFGINRYTPAAGLPSVRKVFADKLARHNGISSLDPMTEVAVTSGSTGAFDGICGSLLNPGDEVILFEPFYPYHRKTLEKWKATIKYVPLAWGDWVIDWELLEKAFSNRTKFIVVSTPSNPCGKVFSREELVGIASLCRKFGAHLVTDEIYEYMVFDGGKHISAASLPEAKDVTITIGGFSKTFSITGWRIGYVAASRTLMEKITALVDLTYVCPPAPLQDGVRAGIENMPETFYSELCAGYQQKRDFWCNTLRHAGLLPNVPEGAYYVLADFSQRFPTLSGLDFVDLMISRTGVGAVPSSDFVRDSERSKWVRFCVAVEDSVLYDAAGRLRNL